MIRIMGCPFRSISTINILTRKTALQRCFSHNSVSLWCRQSKDKSQKLFTWIRSSISHHTKVSSLSKGCRKFLTTEALAAPATAEISPQATRITGVRKEELFFCSSNQDITLTQFKWIWYMEYAHRMWGRMVGAVFYLPAAYFWYKGWFNRGMKIRVGVFGALIMCQGLLGWYMVKSGLDEELISKTEIPRVSPYRLAAHLSLAFILYAGLIWCGLSQFIPRARYVLTPQMRRFRMFAHTCKGFVGFTAFSGAFVAGLDAGLVYNSFPKMADRWIPTDLFALEPKWKNFFENPTTTQFVHRILGTTTVSSIAILFLLARPLTLPGRANIALNCLLGMSALQVSLGIATLLYYVPTHLAASHQAGALSLLTIAVWLTNELRKPLVPK
ncbi:cytochrome c oxidase assembly protein COX15 homolog [Orbicella faveolata]|uniref:cytochrome c oxidase assembly protein COX15 homolog n=1 Tax=Orbicella faveolata TaxID=48498 RepID=UPI0009E31345|nr:cytochrome c oxidase assembly protein COX15 homolog [Orbicella faveolata]